MTTGRTTASRSARMAARRSQALRAAARAEAGAIAAATAETVALEEGRGADFATVDGPTGRRYRRRPGLEHLALKGRLSPAQRAAGERYGAFFRKAVEAGSPASSLAVGGGGATPLSSVISVAEARALAAAELAQLRRRLHWHKDLVGACDMICGQELTPREAAGGEREAGRLEAVLAVALDLLATRDVR